MITKRERKSPFVKLFDKTPPGVVCPHFHELVLSNGCPYDCKYCYLRLTFRGKTKPVLFTNSWQQVEEELDAMPKGVFSTGELADSLAVIPPLLEQALDYFSSQGERYLLLLTKSTNIEILLNREASKQIIVSFSVNSLKAAQLFEKGAPDPLKRIEVAKQLKDRGWRVRIRIDPIILQSGIENYELICRELAEINPERVTIGSLRQYPGLFRFAPDAPRDGLMRSADGRMRYLLETRLKVYQQIKSWLGFQPALCKETEEVWQALGWQQIGCNCTE